MTVPSTWVDAFRHFCSFLKIDSKETGVGPLEFYTSQERYLAEIAEGLDRDIHHFIILKSRQLGVSTISIALDIFWASVNDGLQGAIITHDEASLNDFRAKVDRYLGSLPKELTRGTVKSNRSRLEFNNGSVLNYMVAGTRKGGTLGRAFGLNFVHATECSSWADEEGLISLRNALAERYDRRLYIFESTARGFNLWNQMWEEAPRDPTVKRFFLGWYLHDQQRFERSDPKFAQFWDGELTEAEAERYQFVKVNYDIDVQPEQIAWWRWKTQADEVIGDQEQPWTPEEAFVMSGSPFFNLKELSHAMRRVQKDVRFKPYRYELGEDFLATQIAETKPQYADLHIFEEPDDTGFYVLGADPAGGSNEESNNHCAEIYRCYSDRLVQVAEFANSTMTTAQFAWVCLHLAGAYRSVMLNLEINGPGTAVFQEMEHVRKLMTQGTLAHRIKDHGVKDVFGSVKWYLYHRPDSTGTGLAYHFSTNHNNKRRILNELRDTFSLKNLDIRSAEMLNEMKKVTWREGSIGAEGRQRDDRVMASALAHVAWTDWLRKRLITEGRTFEREQERMALARAGKGEITLQQKMLEEFMRDKRRERSAPAAKWYDNIRPIA